MNPNRSSPEGTMSGIHRLPNVFCFEYVFWVVVDVIPFQESQEFILETLLLVVLFLLLNVLLHGWHLGLTYGEGAIAGLPLESVSSQLLIVDPLGGISFDVLQHERNGYGWVESGQNVDVIVRTANFE
jgi:hypothetical protein